MNNFNINFAYPWFLLALVVLLPAVLIPYFRLAKRYRRTRNRIVTIVCSILVMLFATMLACGLNFTFDIPNDSNEIILLVDLSDTESQSEEERDNLVETIISDAQYDNYKIGIVTFGFNQVYAVPLTNNLNGMYDKYLDSIENDMPDVSATNIASALTYAKGLFSKKASGKIVLITDGKQTDEDALLVIRSVVAQGIKLDIANVKSKYDDLDQQILGVAFPEYHVELEENLNVDVTILNTSGKDANVNVTLFDNGVAGQSLTDYKLVPGENVVTLNHMFTTKDLHEVKVELTSDEDSLEQNNSYYTYYLMQIFDKILVLEKYDDTSKSIEELLEENQEFQVEVVNIEDAITRFENVDDLRFYDQIIMNNIANSDMTKEFVQMLYSYTHDYGGGMLTVGGNDKNDDVHLYNRDDLYATQYQSMLPVQAIDYKPPLGTVFIIDKSGSMSSKMGSDNSILEWATASISSCVNMFSERDYVGILTFDSTEGYVLPLTSCNNKEVIQESLFNIGDPTGTTDPEDAVIAAITMLSTFKSVDKKHIVMITDGEIPSSKTYIADWIAEAYEKYQITFSIAVITQKAEDYAKNMRIFTDAGHGRYLPLSKPQDVVHVMNNEFKTPEILEVSDEPFTPNVLIQSSQLVKDLDFSEIMLDGFYGTKARGASEVTLAGEFDVPIYAKWKFGLGTVGSFMIDLNGKYSGNFMQDINGRTFVKNVVKNIMPLESIRPQQIPYEFKQENYINTLSVYGNLTENQKIKGTMTYVDKDTSVETEISLNEVTENGKGQPLVYVTTPLSVENNYSRCEFVIKQGGAYTIKLELFEGDSNIPVETEVFYKDFSYSAEYRFGLDEEDLAKNLINDLDSRSDGSILFDNSNPVEVFYGFKTEIHKLVDPRNFLSIMIIILFLIEIAVRKFKFKWPHELIMEYKQKKENK